MAVTFRAASNVNTGAGALSIVPTKPSGTLDGDVLIMGYAGHNNAGPSSAPTATWTDQGLLASFSPPTNIEFGRGVFLAADGGTGAGGAGTSNLKMSDSTATTWTDVSTPVWAGAVGITGLLWIELLGIWVAGGGSGKLATSSDGINWVDRSSGTPFTGNVVAFAFGGGVLVGVDSTGHIATSADGISWTLRTTWASGAVTDVTYGNSKFAAIGTVSSATHLETSPTGTTWTAQTTGFAGTAGRHITYGNGLFVASDSGSVRTSADAVTWAAITNTMTSPNCPFVYAADLGMWMTCNSTSNVQVSADGKYWVSAPESAATSATSALAYGNGIWVLSGGSSAHIFTYTGSMWCKLGGLSSIGTVDCELWWKVATGEPASWTFLFGTTTAAAAVVAAFSGADPTVQSVKFAGQQNASSVTITAPAEGTFTSATGIDVGVFGTNAATTVTPPLNYTEPTNGDVSASGGATVELAYRALTSQTTVGSIAATALAAAANVGWHVFVQQAPLPQSNTDPRGLVDSTATAITYNLAFTDNRGLTDLDSESRGIIPAALTDPALSATPTDATSTIRNVNYTPPDDKLTAATPSDSTSTAKQAVQVFDDPGTASADAFTEVGIYARTISPDDTRGLVDVESEDFSRVITPSDVTGLVDVESEAFSKVINPDDQLTAVSPSDSTATFKAVLQTFDDPGTASADSQSSTSVFLRTISPDDDRGLVDAASSASVFLRVISPDDSSGSVDTSTQSWGHVLAAVTDSLLAGPDVLDLERGVPSTLPPDAILVQTNLTGSVTDIDDDPASPDANNLTPSGGIDLRVSFGSPGGTLATGTNIQGFRILAWV